MIWKLYIIRIVTPLAIWIHHFCNTIIMLLVFNVDPVVNLSNLAAILFFVPGQFVMYSYLVGVPHYNCSFHPCKSHDHYHQWVYLVMTWLPYDKGKLEHKVVRLVWEFDGISYKQTWCKKIYHRNTYLSSHYIIMT